MFFHEISIAPRKSPGLYDFTRYVKTALLRDTVLTARVKGLEPSTFRVHLTHYFHSGMDYIFTLNKMFLGIPVSSLYGALTLCFFVCEVPSVFAYLATLIGRCFKRLSLHRYPGKFQSPFRRESCTSTGGRSNQLSYTRN